MTHLTTLTLITLAALNVTACSDKAAEPTTESPSVAAMDHDAMDKAAIDHDMMDHDEIIYSEDAVEGAKGNTGQTTGTLMSISPDGQSATINHAAIEGVNMGAMTMGFDIMSGVDLSGFAANDPVSFRVKRGLDGRYRITAICNTETAGADCLPASMDHTGH